MNDANDHYGNRHYARPGLKKSDAKVKPEPHDVAIIVNALRDAARKTREAAEGSKATGRPSLDRLAIELSRDADRAEELATAFECSDLVIGVAK